MMQASDVVIAVVYNTAYASVYGMVRKQAPSTKTWRCQSSGSGHGTRDEQGYGVIKLSLFCTAQIKGLSGKGTLAVGIPPTPQARMTTHTNVVVH
jgi:hypothetical protein